MDKKDNPMSRLMELAAPYKGEYVLSVILAILGVAAGLLPFFAVSKIVIWAEECTLKWMENQ